MNISKVLLLGQPQCPKCYIPLQNRLNIDVTNYENNTAVFIHPKSYCEDANKETKPFLLRNFVEDLDNHLSFNEIHRTGPMSVEIEPKVEESIKFKYKDGNGNFIDSEAKATALAKDFGGNPLDYKID